MSYSGPYSYKDLSVTSTTTSYDFTLEHLRITHLAPSYKSQTADTFTDLDSADYTITASGSTVTVSISSTPSDWETGGTLRLSRSTPVASSGRLVDFQDGSLSSDDLDTSALQNLYIAEEVWDDTQDSLGKESGNPQA